MDGTAAGDEGDIRWAFGAFELSQGHGLLREGADVGLAVKPLSMLEYLLRHRDRVCSRRELLEHIWPDVAVSGAAFDSVVRDLRRALGDRAAQPIFVATKRARGLRFIGLVRELPANGASTWKQAATHFERALEALELLERGRARLPSGEQRERGELLVALARARWAGGLTAEARQAFLDAATVGRSASDGDVLARAALGVAGRTDITPGVNREAVTLLEEALVVLPSEDSPLRAEVLARLATESYYTDDMDRTRTMATEAVAMAERAGDPGILAYALTALHFVRQLPEVHPSERLPIDDRVFELLPDDPSSDVLALGVQQRTLDLLEIGDGDGFRRSLARLQALERALEQPFISWMASLLDGTRLLVSGDAEGAEQAAHVTLELGQRIGTPNALPAFAGQLFGVRRTQGRLPELVPVMDELAGNGEMLPIFRAGRTAVHAAAATGSRAREAIDEAFEYDLADHPRDQNWIATLGTLAPPVARHGSESQIRRLFAELAPYHDRIIVVGQGATTHGAVSYHLALLSEALGEADEAARWRTDAKQRHRKLGAGAWAGRVHRGAG